MYDERPPDEFTFIDSIGIGNSGIAQFTAKVTKLVNEVNDVLTFP